MTIKELNKKIQQLQETTDIDLSQCDLYFEDEGFCTLISTITVDKFNETILLQHQEVAKNESDA